MIDTWYHHPRCQQCDLSWNRKGFKVATRHYRCRHHHKLNVFDVICYYHNLIIILLQSNLNILFCNHLIWPSNAALGDPGNRTWNRMLVAVATCHNHSLHFNFNFILILQRLTELRPFKCLGHLVTLWPWHFTCDLENSCLLRSSSNMYSPKRRLRYSHLLTRYCPNNLFQGATFAKHQYRGQL